MRTRLTPHLPILNINKSKSPPLGKKESYARRPQPIRHYRRSLDRLVKPNKNISNDMVFSTHNPSPPTKPPRRSQPSHGKKISERYRLATEKRLATLAHKKQKQVHFEDFHKSYEFHGNLNNLNNSSIEFTDSNNEEISEVEDNDNDEVMSDKNKNKNNSIQSSNLFSTEPVKLTSNRFIKAPMNLVSSDDEIKINNEDDDSINNNSNINIEINNKKSKNKKLAVPQRTMDFITSEPNLMQPLVQLSNDNSNNKLYELLKLHEEVVQNSTSEYYENYKSIVKKLRKNINDLDKKIRLESIDKTEAPLQKPLESFSLKKIKNDTTSKLYNTLVRREIQQGKIIDIINRLQHDVRESISKLAYMVYLHLEDDTTMDIQVTNKFINKYENILEDHDNYFDLTDWVENILYELPQMKINSIALFTLIRRLFNSIESFSRIAAKKFSQHSEQIFQVLVTMDKHEEIREDIVSTYNEEFYQFHHAYDIARMQVKMMLIRLDGVMKISKMQAETIKNLSKQLATKRSLFHELRKQIHSQRDRIKELEETNKQLEKKLKLKQLNKKNNDNMSYSQDEYQKLFKKFSSQKRDNNILKDVIKQHGQLFDKLLYHIANAFEDIKKNKVKLINYNSNLLVRNKTWNTLNREIQKIMNLVKEQAVSKKYINQLSYMVVMQAYENNIAKQRNAILQNQLDTLIRAKKELSKSKFYKDSLKLVETAIGKLNQQCNQRLTLLHEKLNTKTVNKLQLANIDVTEFKLSDFRKKLEFDFSKINYKIIKKAIDRNYRVMEQVIKIRYSDISKSYIHSYDFEPSYIDSLPSLTLAYTEIENHLESIHKKHGQDLNKFHFMNINHVQHPMEPEIDLDEDLVNSDNIDPNCEKLEQMIGDILGFVRKVQKNEDKAFDTKIEKVIKELQKNSLPDISNGLNLSMLTDKVQIELSMIFTEAAETHKNGIKYGLSPLRNITAIEKALTAPVITYKPRTKHEIELEISALENQKHSDSKL